MNYLIIINLNALLQTKPNEVLAIGHLAHRGSLLRRLYPQGSFECELIMGKFILTKVCYGNVH